MGARSRRLAKLILLLISLPAAGAAQQGPPPAVREAVDAVVRYISTGEEAARRDLIARLADRFRRSFTTEAELTRHLAQLHRGVAGPVEGITVERDPEGLLVNLTGRPGLTLRLALDSAGGITRLERAAESAAGDPRERDRGADAAADLVAGHVDAIMALAADEGAAARFIAERMTPELRASRPAAEWRIILDRLAVQAAAMVVQMARNGDESVLSLQGATLLRVRLRVEELAPYRLRSLMLDSSAVAPPQPAGPALTWQTLEARLQVAEREGFAGAVLAIHNGHEMLHRGYGMADRVAGRPNGAETIFDIGALPIDFTRAAIFLLLQQDRLTLDDPITRFLPDVPADKHGITIRHLLTGRSGLHNFHGRPEDADPDLTWIDRAEAERRILSQRLLFAPGSDRSPSHSAFGLLAAVVERVSGVTYEDFVGAHFFRPAGMRRTGPYGDSLGLSASSFAVGYGLSSVGEPNIPPNWGPTSWLIKGSGGMVSTPADMHRFFQYVRSGQVLRGEALTHYLDRGSAVGATDRGFFFLHAWAGGDSMVFLARNAGAEGPGGGALARLIEALVRDDGAR